MVLGTLITEHEQGVYNNLRILSNDNNGLYINRLIELAVFYNFDGWLINIESPFSDSNEATKFSNWLKQLKTKLKLVIPHGQVT